MREAAVSAATTGARGIWVGQVELPPGMVSAVHHHGDAESAIYVISGQASFLSGERLQQEDRAGPGDFVWVPPHEIHVEMNLSADEPVRMVVSRSTQEGSTFNLGELDSWRRSPA